MRTSPLAAALACVVAVVLGVALASPALAHTRLKSSTPAKGATVTTLDEVSLTFTESVRFPSVLVRDAGGRDHHAGKPKLDGPTLTQRLSGALPSGTYTIAWRVVSRDGHPIAGEIPFTVKAPAAGTPSAAPSSGEGATITPSPPPPTPAPVNVAPAAERQEQSSGGIPAWVWIALFSITGVGIGLVISLRKKS